MRVLVGGSFACDDAIARPLQRLLQEVTPRHATVDVEWLAYGSAADLSSLIEPLERARADLVVLLVRLSDLETAHPELQSSAEPADRPLRFLSQLRAYDTRADGPPLVVLFCPSPPVSFESEEAVLCHEMASLARVSSRPSGETIAFFQDNQWYDATGDKRAHAPFTQRMLDVLALGCVRQIARLWIQSPKKVIVLDCDNTLWGGAVADVGAVNVDLSDRFLALQRFVVDQQQRGALLCLCSKNIPDDVDAVFRDRSSEMILCPDHIVLRTVNWRPKSENIRAIAHELQLGLDAFVFVDDNAIECHDVATALPMVAVVHVPHDAGPTFLATQWVLDPPLDYRATAEDNERTRLYQQNAQRHALEQRSTSTAAFLSSLGIRIQCEQLSDVASPAFARVLQLHQRTNTFNVATTLSRALSDEQLATYVSSAERFALASTVTDRYGHYGLVCVALGRIYDDQVSVDSFLMSCRSLNRGVEHAMLKRVAEIAQRHRVDTIRVAWEPTVRNEPARMFFASLSASVLVITSKSERVTTRADKITQSASTGGWWELPTCDAIKISFLREQQVQELSTAYVTVRAVAKRLVIALLLQFVFKWIPRTWFRRVLAWLNKLVRLRTIDADRSRSSAKLSFHSTKQLDDFLGRDPCDQQHHVKRDETDEAFRMRARQETKLLLLEHVAPDAPRVVWAPHRDDDVRLDEAPKDDLSTADTLQQFHRPCATPSCSTRVHWESVCAFARCRTCCYRVQRLLQRATSDRVHAKAQSHARSSLLDDYDIHIEKVQQRDEWCSAHTNDRRRQ